MLVILELKYILKYYLDGDEFLLILDNLDLLVFVGEFVVILGFLGLGKSIFLFIVGLFFGVD